MENEALLEIFKDYHYGREGILDKNLSIEVDYKNKCAKISPFQVFDRAKKTGCCAELMCLAFADLGEREEFQDYWCIRVDGRDNKLFRDPGSQHNYLLLFKKNPMGKTKVSSSPRAVERALSKKPLLVDPSFKKVRPFKGSGYKAEKIYNETTIENYPMEALFFQEDNIPLKPLYITPSGGLVGIGVYFSKKEDFIVIGGQGGRRKPWLYYLNDPRLDILSEANPSLKNYVDKFRHASVMETHWQDFKLDYVRVGSVHDAD